MSNNKKEYTCICNKCGKEYKVFCTESQYNRGAYRKTCSISCANSRPMTDVRRKNIQMGLLRYNKEKDKIEYQYVCDKCGKMFVTYKRIRCDRYKHCDVCIQKRKHFKDNPQSLLDLSKRTVSKILYRAHKSCVICGWNESTCDIHHVIERKNGGSDDLNNLIIVCPNCHRVIHTTTKYSKDYLQTLTLDKTFTDWKDFYYISN